MNVITVYASIKRIYACASVCHYDTSCTFIPSPGSTQKSLKLEMQISAETMETVELTNF